MRTHSKYYLAGAVALLTFVVYLPALQNSFVEWDDNIYVYENPHIRSMNGAFFGWAFSAFHGANWHPLTWISHALDYAIWGLNPLGHHLTNNILHAANTFLVVLLTVTLMASRQTGTLTGPHGSRFVLIAATTTGLLFGLHPLHVESVAWVSERKDLLCALFFLLSIMAYTKYAAATSQRAKGMGQDETGGVHSTGVYFAFTQRSMLYALCFFILALLSKPMAVTLPFVLLILDWYPFGRIQSLRSCRTAFIEKLPFIALSLISSIVTILAQHGKGATTLTEYVPLWARMVVAARALIAYIQKMLLPFDLLPFYHYPRSWDIWSSAYLLPVLLVAVITIICIRTKKHGIWLAVWSYYVITLTPVLGIIQVGGQSMADRYTYLPSLGPFLITGFMSGMFYEKIANLTRWGTVLKLCCIFAAGAALFFMSLITVRQIGVWKDGLVLWGYAIEKEPLSDPYAYNNRGFILMGKGSLDEATEHFEIAIRLDPGYADAYNNLCLAYKSKGLYNKAIEQCRTAIGIKPDYAEAHNNLGVVYKLEGLDDKAVEQYRIALRLKPDYAEALFNLGIVYLDRGDLETARRAFEEGLKLRPDDYKAREVLNSISNKIE